MLKKNKSQYSPELWARGIVHDPVDEAELRDESHVLRDRYRRGMLWYGKLLDNDWWRFVRDRDVLRQLKNLREEYRELLQILAGIQRRARAVTSAPSYPTPPATTRRVDPTLAPKRGFEIYMPPRDEDPGRTIFIPVPESPTGTLEATAPIDSMFDDSSTKTFVGHGGGFGGAGASGDWSEPVVSAVHDASPVDTASPSVDVGSSSIDTPSSD